MREFFEGWRRKVGCVTLVMACVFAAGWVRSFRVEDGISFPTGDPNIGALVSVNGEIGLIQWYDDDNLWPDGAVPQVASTPFPPATPTSLGTWIWCCCGLGVKGWLEHRYYVISYWSIVIPLTLLSAYLLLWKPRPKERRHA